MRCWKCEQSENFSPIYKTGLCKKCYIRIHGACEKCGEEPQIKESSLCHECILEYLDIDEIFKDDFINDRKNELNISNRSNCKFLLVISIYKLV